MSLVSPSMSGYYDDDGQWRRTKFCFAACMQCDCTPPNGAYYSAAHDKRKQQAKFQPEQRVIYTKRGESRFFDTQWPGVYKYQTPSGKHAVLLDGRKRLSLVLTQNLRAELGESLE